MPDFSANIDRNFKAASFAEPVTLTIKEVKLEEVGADKDTKPVLHFLEDRRGLALNGTKYNDISIATGTRDTDKWVGVKVYLEKDPHVQYKGKTVGGIKLTVVK